MGEAMFLVSLLLGMAVNLQPFATAMDTAATVVVGSAICDPPVTVKLDLEVKITNSSRRPLGVGRIEVARERFYRDDSGRLSLLGTSATPDEFPPMDSAGATEGRQDSTLAVNSTKAFRLAHYIHLLPKDVESVVHDRKLIVSFEVTNVESNGHASEYWTRPITIVLPEDCQILRKGERR